MQRQGCSRSCWEIDSWWRPGFVVYVQSEPRWHVQGQPNSEFGQIGGKRIGREVDNWNPWENAVHKTQKRALIIFYTLRVRLDMVNRNTRQVPSGCPSQVRKNSISPDTEVWHPRNKRGHSSNLPLPELWYRVYYGFIQRSRCQNGKLWQQCSTCYLFVVFSFLFHFSSNLAISYYLDHRPRVIGSEKALH